MKLDNKDITIKTRPENKSAFIREESAFVLKDGGDNLYFSLELKLYMDLKD